VVGSRFREAVLTGLRDLGYVEGQHIAIEWRSWEGSLERLRALATELAELRVDVVVVGPTSLAEEMKRASSTVPIVAIHGDQWTVAGCQSGQTGGERHGNLRPEYRADRRL